MGIDLATWRARIGLYYYRICHPYRIKWRSSYGQLYKPGVTSWGVREVMPNDTPLILKGCMAVVALSLILEYVVHTLSKGRGGGGKVRCHWREATFQVRETVDGGMTLVLSSFMVVVLLLIAGDVELNPGPGEQLEIDDLAAVRQVLFDIRAKWYHIGVELGLPVGTLDAIRTQFTDLTDCVTEMCSKWLKGTHPSPTWDDLIKAVESPFVGEKSLAQKLRKSYCRGGEENKTDTSLGQPQSTVALEAQRTTTVEENVKSSCLIPKSDDEDTHPNEYSSCTSPPASEKSPFGCGCGKCTFFSFIERGCPKPIPSASSFPYLNLSGLTHEQQQELRGRLRFESQEIMMQFQKLVSATILSLEKQQIPLTRLVSHLMTLGAFDPVYKEGEQTPAFHHHFKELQTADTVPKVFLVLADYFSFFNWHIIEHIITVLGTGEDNDNLQRYKTQFDQYAKRRIYECLPQFGSVSATDHADVFVKVDLRYENYTVTEIERFRCQLSELLHISPQGVLRLCRVEKGCFQLTFQVPSFVQREIFPLSQEQEEVLAEKGVIRLTCVDYQFLAEENEESQSPVVYAKIPKHVKPQYDINEDSAISVGASTFTTRKGTSFFEDLVDRDLEEVDYELRVQGLVEASSVHQSESSLELHRAALKGELEIVRFLVDKKNCNPMDRDQQGYTALHMAAFGGNLDVLEYFVTEKSYSPACFNSLGLTPLHLASGQGCLSVVKYLITEQQMDPQCEDEYGNTPLHRACTGGYLAVVRFIVAALEMYAPITELIRGLRNKWNRTPLDSAILNGHLDIVRFIISEQKCDPNILTQYGRTPLHTAAEFGYLHIVKYLSDEQGCNPSCLDEYEYTPLHCAAMKGHMDMVKFLTVKKHCDPMCRESNQCTPLHMAALNGHTDLVRFLALEMRCDLTSRNDINDTPLHLAVQNGHLEIVKFFISEQNCDPNIPGQYGRTPLHSAAEFGYLHIVKYLSDEQGCNLSCLDEYKYTPLHCAAIKEHMDIVKFLTVEKYCDPMCRDCDQNTPLHKAALNGHTDLVRFLALEMHCNLTSRNGTKKTPLHLAVQNGHLEIVKFFISEQNCDPNIPGQYGRTPLHSAAEFGHLHIVKYLSDEQGCNPSCLDEKKYTPLHCAAMKGHMNVVKFLTVEKHCDPMCRDFNESTPLHRAALNGHTDVVRFLTLEMHCDPTSRNGTNKTPFNLAVQKRHLKIVKILLLNG